MISWMMTMKTSNKEDYIMNRYEMVKAELAGAGVGRIRRQANLNEGIAITIKLNEKEWNSFKKAYPFSVIEFLHACGGEFTLKWVVNKIKGIAVSEIFSQRIADKVSKAMAACEKYGYRPEDAIWFKWERIIEVTI